MKFLLVYLIIPCIIYASGCFSQKQMPNLNSGKSIVRSYCVQCHALSSGSIQISLHDYLVQVGERKFIKYMQKEFENQYCKGHEIHCPLMSHQDIIDVVGYIRSL